MTNKFRNERGQTVTEFALIAPLLLILLLAILQFGIVFRNYLALTDAVREGARKAAVARSMAGSRENYVKGEVKKSADGLESPPLEINVTSSWAPGSDVVVSASYPFEINLLGVVVKSGRMTSTTTERVE